MRGEGVAERDAEGGGGWAVMRSAGGKRMVGLRECGSEGSGPGGGEGGGRGRVDGWVMGGLR